MDGVGKARVTYHGGCRRSSDAFVNLPRRLDQRWPVHTAQTEGCLVLLCTVLLLLLLLLLTSLLRLLLPGPLPASDPSSHREAKWGSGVRGR